MIFEISPTTKAKIDEWVKKFPLERKQSALLQALMFVQQDNGGWLNEPAMNAVADYLSLPRIAVYEVATFYDMYDLKPVGQTKIDICTNISCKLCGCGEIMKQVENRLGIKAGETTPDGKFTLKGVECLAACVNAPVMQINDIHYVENLTTEKVDAIMDKLERGESIDGK